MTAIPSSWVRRIFHELRLTYGSAFDRQWAASETGTTDPEKRQQELEQHAHDLIEHWARGLGGFAGDRAYALRYALDNLPAGPFPPNLTEFRALARAAPEPPMARLPYERDEPTPERLARLLEVRRAIGGLARKMVTPDAMAAESKPA